MIHYHWPLLSSPVVESKARERADRSLHALTVRCSVTIIGRVLPQTCIPKYSGALLQTYQTHCWEHLCCAEDEGLVFWTLCDLSRSVATGQTVSLLQLSWLNYQEVCHRYFWCTIKRVTLIAMTFDLSFTAMEQNLDASLHRSLRFARIRQFPVYFGGSLISHAAPPSGYPISCSRRVIMTA